MQINVDDNDGDLARGDDDDDDDDGDLARGGSKQRLALQVPVVAHLTWFQIKHSPHSFSSLFSFLLAFSFLSSFLLILFNSPLSSHFLSPLTFSAVRFSYDF